MTRIAAQQYLAGLYTTALVGVGLPVQQVYDHKVYDLAGTSPVIVVSAIGTEYAQTTYGMRPAAWLVTVFVFVLHSDIESGVTNEDAEIQLADIEARLLEIHKAADLTGSPHWASISYLANTGPIVTEIIGGVTYKIEAIQLRLAV